MKNGICGDFAYFDGRDYYFLTQFEQVLKGITGYLILDYKGNIIPFEEAKTPALALVSFNTLIHSAMKEMVPRMLKDMSSYKEMSIHLPAKRFLIFYGLLFNQIMVLKKTMQRFVEGFAEENIKLDESNLQQSFDEKITKSGLKAFEEKIVPKIRNPK